MARRVLEIGVVARDGEEGFKGFPCEEPCGVFGGFVGHEPIDEDPCARDDAEAAERGVEEVRVLGDGFSEACCAVGGEEGEVDAVVVLLSEFVEGLELLQAEEEVVSAVWEERG